jgi:hypothetical protein
MTGQTPDKSPDAHRMPLARGDNASDAASCVTFDGSTRLRTERPAVAISSRRPGSRLFSTSIPTDTQSSSAVPNWG